MVKTVDFGAFVNFFGARDGLVHISQLGSGRVNKTTDTSPETAVSWTVTIPSATGIDEPLEFPISGTFMDLDVLSADVLASDGQTDSITGIASLTVEWE